MRVLLLLLVVGCHDAVETAGPDAASARSGIDPALQISALDAAQRMQLCVWETTTLGGPGYVHMCNECNGNACTDYTVTVNTVDMCVAQLQQLADCGARVGDDEACTIGQAPDLCA